MSAPDHARAPANRDSNPADAALARLLPPTRPKPISGEVHHESPTTGRSLVRAAPGRSWSRVRSRVEGRADLFYRLSGVEIHVPPLRSRREDIRELAIFFLGRHRATRELTMADAALNALRLYDWPGNVRELSA